MDPKRVIVSATITTLVLAAIAALVAYLLVGLGEPRPARNRAPAVPVEPKTDTSGPAEKDVRPADPGALSKATPSTAAASGVRWIVAGGGASPSSNEVSIEADIALASRVLPGDGVVLYAAGPGSRAVQVRDGASRSDTGDPLMRRLGEFFAPRAGRDARYRLTTLDALGPATRPRLLGTLKKALSTRAQPSSPLTLALAGHGEKGAVPAESRLAMWGGWTLTPGDLAKALDESSPAGGGRQVRLVVTSCFSGGFAEVAFANADATAGLAASSDRCGLFAAPFDLESSGCDADPDRRKHDGYAVYFYNALAGRDEAGADLPLSDLDLDGDGSISLLEAHSRVRIRSPAIDVPTTTSERWLNVHAAPLAAKAGSDSEPPPRVHLVEEEAVIRSLTRRLKLADADEARDEFSRLDAAIVAADKALLDLERAETEAFWDASAEILGRWPVLDDPWHPDFARTLSEERPAIQAYLSDAAPMARYRVAFQRVDAARMAIAKLQTESAPFERLVRALDIRLLAGYLRAEGGAAWQNYERLLACERSVP